jgi:hypothetical protein
MAVTVAHALLLIAFSRAGAQGELPGTGADHLIESTQVRIRRFGEVAGPWPRVIENHSPSV